MTNPTPLQVSALRASLSIGLKSFRKGYAPDRAGPFYTAATIRALERQGLLRMTATGQRAVATDKGSALCALIDDVSDLRRAVEARRADGASSHADGSHATMRDVIVPDRGTGPDL
jgi:hypothetical protein